MKKIFSLRSLRTGRLHRLTDGQIQEFYDNEILGQRKHLSTGKIMSMIAGLFGDIVSPFEVVGTVLLQLRNASGDLVHVNAAGNLVTTAGLGLVIDRLQAASPAVCDYQAIGTGTTAAALGDTTLQTETGTRVQGTLSQPAATTDRLVSTFAAGNGTAAITETGRLNASSVGTLFARQVFSAVNKGASDSLQITHDITVS